MNEGFLKQNAPVDEGDDVIFFSIAHTPNHAEATGGGLPTPQPLDE